MRHHTGEQTPALNREEMTSIDINLSVESCNIDPNVASVFRKLPHETKTSEEQNALRATFHANAVDIYNRHFEQTRESVEQLNVKYSVQRVGLMSVYDAFLSLSRCIDPSDTDLYATNQLIHSLQVAEAMEVDGIPDEMIVVGLVHDIGKILLLAGEDPKNVVCPNEPIGNFEHGVGLENIIVNWNHDEYAYQKLKGFLSEDMSWLLRFHSLRFDKAEHYMSATDRERMETLLEVFRYYDLKTKSPYHVPTRTPEHYKDLLDSYFPVAIEF